MKFFKFELIIAWIFLFAGIASATESEIVFTVGGDKEKGKAMASSAGGKWGKSLSKGFKNAAKAINAAKGAKVIACIKVAAGEYDGDFGSGAYILPEIKNPKAILIIEGGYSPDFVKRDPFLSPTKLVTTKDRSAPLLKFRASTPHNQDELAALIINGLVMDVGNSNAYDAKTNSLLKGKSCSHPIISFGYFKTNLLELTNCVFVNAANRAFETLIRPASDDCEIKLCNCIFLNCLIPVKLDTARYRHKPSKIIVDHCSFLLNWGFNPDPNTGNPCALEIGPKDAAKKIMITNNLFFCNFGGAILALNKQMPALTINNNNFVGNGLLHGLSASDAVAMVVEAGGKKQAIDVDTIEELDAVEEAENNVSIPPDIALFLGEVKPIDNTAIKTNEGWENQVRRILGMNLQGAKVDIKDFAPKKTFDTVGLLLPKEEKAKPYGAVR